MVYIVCGYPGAGKTTWVHNHAKRNDVIYDLDALVSAMCTTERNSNAVYIANNMLCHFLNYSADLECDVYVIRTLPDKELDGYLVEYILIDTPIEICKKRRKSNIPWEKIKKGIEHIKKTGNLKIVFANEERW